MLAGSGCLKHCDEKDSEAANTHKHHVCHKVRVLYMSTTNIGIGGSLVVYWLGFGLSTP